MRPSGLNMSGILDLDNSTLMILPTSLAATPLLAPTLILVLCAVAGIGTYLLMPSRRENATRAIGAVIIGVAGLVMAALLIRAGSNYITSDGGGMGAYFWIFSAIALASALRVITHPRPVYSALYFVLTVFASAGLFVLLWAEFMAVALVLIYAGAILVTYVFVIMLASQAGTSVDKTGAATGLAEYDTTSREPLVATVLGFTLAGFLLYLVFDKSAAVTPVPASPALVTSSVQDLGMVLFRDHLISLELAGVILTISMVGAIVISRRRVATQTGLLGEPTGPTDIVNAPNTPIDDNPNSIPVTGSDNPRQKAYPET